MTEVEMKKQNLKKELVDGIYDFLNADSDDEKEEKFEQVFDKIAPGYALSADDVLNDEKVANAVRDLDKEIVWQISNGNDGKEPFPDSYKFEWVNEWFAFDVLMNIPAAKLLLTDQQTKQVKQVVDDFIEECKWQFDEHVFAKIDVNGFDYDNIDDIRDYLENAYI